MLALQTDCPLATTHQSQDHAQQRPTTSPSHKFYVENLEEEQRLGGLICIAGATSTYKFKGEDRTAVWRNKEQRNLAHLSSSISSTECISKKDAVRGMISTTSTATAATSDFASNSNGFLHLLAFCGVFDGHGGPLAAEYCARGLLPMIMLETEKSGVTDDLPEHSNRPPSPRLVRRPSLRKVLSKTRIHQQDTDSPEIKRATVGMPSLETAYVRAFHNCQAHFGTGEDPLTTPPTPRVFARKNSLRNLISRPFHQCEQNDEFFVGGGTTACTLSIYSSPGPNDPGIFAVVANCGDSRLLCDNGSPAGPFTQVTRDHRPLDPEEAQRLKEFAAEEGESSCHVQHLPHHTRTPARIFPGGLAVSRTIGDLNYSKGVVPTPDVIRWRLDREEDKENNGSDAGTNLTHRFLLATDGLWDVTSNDDIGVLAAQQDSNGTPVSSRSAASKVMEHCLERGGFVDDITIMIVDVTLP